MRRFLFSCTLFAAFSWLIGPVAHTQSGSASCNPGINFGSLIAPLGVEYGSSQLNIRTSYAVCLPMPDKPSSSHGL